MLWQPSGSGTAPGREIPNRSHRRRGCIIDILELIDQLERVATGAKKVPLSNRAVIDPEKLLELVDQMRVSVPRSVQEAQEVLEKREQIINQSMMDARRVKSAADNEARGRVDQSEVVSEAKKRADDIMVESRTKATQFMAQLEAEVASRRAGANEYAQGVLHKLEDEVDNILSTVRRGLMVLSPEIAPVPISPS